MPVTLARRKLLTRGRLSRFRDNFDRANGNLTDGLYWTLAEGPATGLAINAGAVDTVGTAATTVATCPDLRLRNHYAQVTIGSGSSSRGYILAKYIDANSWIRLAKIGANYVFEVDAAGAYNIRASIAGSIAPGNVLKLLYVNGVAWFFKNGIAIGSYTLTASENAVLINGTRCGLCSGSNTTVGYFYAFEHGAV